MLLMGKLTISMAIFNSKPLVITRGYFLSHEGAIPLCDCDEMGGYHLGDAIRRNSETIAARPGLVGPGLAWKRKENDWFYVN